MNGTIAISKDPHKAVARLKNFRPKKNTPSNVANPDNIDKNLPANNGSEKILKRGAIAHIKSGVLPSDNGKKRKVGYGASF
jgi:hypothetical protein